MMKAFKGKCHHCGHDHSEDEIATPPAHAGEVLRSLRGYLHSDLSSPCSLTDHITLGNSKQAHETVAEMTELIDHALSSPSAPAPVEVTESPKLAAMETALRAIIDCAKGSDGSNVYNACVALNMKLIAVAALTAALKGKS